MLANLMEMKHNRMDIGETAPWKEEVEPVIAKIDNWGRSSIPVRKVIRHKVPEAVTIVEPDARSNVSRRSRLTTLTKQNSMRRTDTQGVEIIDEAQEAQPQPLQADEEEVPEEVEQLRGKKDYELKRKKEDEAAAKVQRLKDIENQKKIDRIQGDLKGKDYTYDHMGRILMVQPIKFEKMAA